MNIAHQHYCERFGTVTLSESSGVSHSRRVLLNPRERFVEGHDMLGSSPMLGEANVFFMF